MARARGSQIYSPDIVEELKNAMAIESRAGEDDEVTFRQKMNALQRFLNHGISRFSIETWHHALTALFHAYQPFHNHNPHHQYQHHHHHHPEDDPDKPVLSRLKGLGDLRTLSRDVMLQREGGVLREGDAQALKYLDNFLVALHCVREAKGCVGDLHRFLYRYYYDPGSGREQSQLQSGKAMSRAATMHTPGGGAAASSYEASAKQFGILTLQQMSGSTGHKLRRTVADMQEILARWDRLMTEGEIQQEDLDAESHQDLQMLSGTAAFEPVLRLMPDIFAKFYKCLELLKQWWVLAHEIYPELPINRPPTPLSEEESTGTVSRLESDSELSALNTSLDQSTEDQVPISEQLQKVEDSIQVREDKLLSLKNELKLLEERERYFESLKEAYDKVTFELEEQTRQRKELVTVREKETFPPHNQMVDVSATDHITASKPYTSPEELNEQVARVENEMQMLQFQQSLLRQDYMVQLEVRPSLIRFADDLRIKIAEAQNSLVEDKMERIKLQTLAGEETCIASPRSVARSEVDPSPVTDVHPSPVTEDAQPQNRTVDKAAERKQELTRLLHKPMREDTSGSSVTGQTTAIVAEAKKRRQSLPAAPKEDATDKTTPIPAIKIHHASPSKRTTSVINAQSPRKSPRGPTLSPINDAKQPQRKSPDADSQRGPETLFHRRAGKPQGHEATTEKSGERRPNQVDHPLRRPRAMSDSHALKTGTNTLKVNLESSHRLKTTVPEEKSLPKEAGSKSAPRDGASSNESHHDSQAASKRAKPLSVARKTSTSKSPDDAKKNAVTSQRPKSDDTKGSKADDARGFKADGTKASKTDGTKASKVDDSKGFKADDTKRSSEAKKQRISPTAHSTKAAEVKKQPDQTSSNPKPDNDKKEQGKPLPKSTTRQADRSPQGTEQSPKEKEVRQTDKSPHRAQPSPKERDNKQAARSPHGTQLSPTEKESKQAVRSPHRTQPSPKEKDEDKKRHTAAPLKPAEKAPNKTTTSQKPTQNDVKKDSDKTTLAHTKQDDKRGNRITAPEARKQRDVKEEGKSNHKVDDVRDAEKVTSQKLHATRRPNGVIAKK